MRDTVASGASLTSVLEGGVSEGVIQSRTTQLHAAKYLIHCTFNTKLLLSYRDLDMSTFGVNCSW